MEQKTQTLFEKYGGKPAVEKVADYFYTELVLKDTSINHFFTKTDMTEQRKKQAMFITFALGGASKYTGKTMGTVHAGRGIHSEHFDAVVNHLVSALKVHGFEQTDIDSVVAKLAPMKSEIVEA